jgi:hypothetical protein
LKQDDILQLFLILPKYQVSQTFMDGFHNRFDLFFACFAVWTLGRNAKDDRVLGGIDSHQGIIPSPNQIREHGFDLTFPGAEALDIPMKDVFSPRADFPQVCFDLRPHFVNLAGDAGQAENVARVSPLSRNGHGNSRRRSVGVVEHLASHGKGRLDPIAIWHGALPLGEETLDMLQGFR